MNFNSQSNIDIGILNGLRFYLIVIMLFCSVCSFAQTTVEGWVKDSKTEEPLLYCSISVKGSTKGTITNGEGMFHIFVDPNKDTLLFSYVGYEPQAIPVTLLLKNLSILLKRKDVLLDEVVIHSKDDFIFDILDRCRRKLIMDQTSRTAKVYYGIETQTKEQPIEQLECYYNGYMNGISIEKLGFKNGKLGLAVLDKRYFLTLNASAAISRINLTKRDEFYPFIPFQLNKRELKRYFRVKIKPGDHETYQIEFQPRKKEISCFSGEVWMDKETFAMRKISLNIENTSKHPFLPLFSKDSLLNVNLKIDITIKQDGNSGLLDHIDFNYDVAYKSVREKPTVEIPSVITRDIITKGVLYFYDYDNPFILPWFEYDNGFDDYRKMSFIPYNNFFWKSNFTLCLTEKQKENLGFFSQNGHLINYGEGNYGKDFLKFSHTDSTFSKLYDSYYTFWSPDKRIRLNRELAQNNIYPQEKINNSIQSNLYDLKVQILLDVTQSGDTLHHRSYTVFDAGKTFFHLPEQPYTTVFLNICFDLCEIERRKMEKGLSLKSWTVAQVDSIYKETIESIAIITRRYLKDVQLGKNEKSLHAWNEYVIKNLNIDNIALFPHSTNP